MLALEPGKSLTTNEISAAALAIDGDVFNPQQQFTMTWPTSPVVATARVDQIARSGALKAGLEPELRAALDDAKAALDEPGAATDRPALASRLEALASSVGGTSQRHVTLSATLKHLAARLR